MVAGHLKPWETERNQCVENERGEGEIRDQSDHGPCEMDEKKKSSDRTKLQFLNIICNFVKQKLVQGREAMETPLMRHTGHWYRAEAVCISDRYSRASWKKSPRAQEQGPVYEWMLEWAMKEPMGWMEKERGSGDDLMSTRLIVLETSQSRRNRSNGASWIPRETPVMTLPRHQPWVLKGAPRRESLLLLPPHGSFT